MTLLLNKLSRIASNVLSEDGKTLVVYRSGDGWSYDLYFSDIKVYSGWIWGMEESADRNDLKCTELFQRWARAFFSGSFPRDYFASYKTPEELRQAFAEARYDRN